MRGCLLLYMIGILLFAILVCLVAFWYSIKDLLPFLLLAGFAVVLFYIFKPPKE